jgi:DNA polymerase-3 subunit beta
MQLVLDRNAFCKALAHCQIVVEKRTTIPILSHILLEAQENDILKLTATDLDLAIIEGVPAHVTAPGRTTVSASMLYDIVRKFKEDAEVCLTFAASSHQLIVESGRSRFTLSTLSADDFPVVARGPLPKHFILPTINLKKLIEGTRFAMSQEETTYYLNGIYLHAVEGKELRAVATDGHRLARVSVPLPKGADDIPGVIISRKTIHELLKLIEAGDEEVEISLSETQISFKFRDAFLTSRLIDGTFPDYQKVIPTQNEKRLCLNMQAFSEAVDRVATIAAEKTRGVRLSISEGRLAITATGGDMGHAHEELEVDYAADALEIGFNARYLLDIAHQFEGDADAECQIADAGSPVVIRNRQDDSVLFVVMPMRI